MTEPFLNGQIADQDTHQHCDGAAAGSESDTEEATNRCAICLQANHTDLCAEQPESCVCVPLLKICTTCVGDDSRICVECLSRLIAAASPPESAAGAPPLQNEAPRDGSENEQHNNARGDALTFFTNMLESLMSLDEAQREEAVTGFGQICATEISTVLQQSHTCLISNLTLRACVFKELYPNQRLALCATSYAHQHVSDATLVRSLTAGWLYDVLGLGSSVRLLSDFVIGQGDHKNRRSCKLVTVPIDDVCLATRTSVRNTCQSLTTLVQDTAVAQQLNGALRSDHAKLLQRGGLTNGRYAREFEAKCAAVAAEKIDADASFLHKPYTMPQENQAPRRSSGTTDQRDISASAKRLLMRCPICRTHQTVTKYQQSAADRQEMDESVPSDHEDGFASRSDNRNCTNAQRTSHTIDGSIYDFKLQQMRRLNVSGKCDDATSCVPCACCRTHCDSLLQNHKDHQKELFYAHTMSLMITCLALIALSCHLSLFQLCTFVPFAFMALPVIFGAAKYLKLHRQSSSRLLTSIDKPALLHCLQRECNAFVQVVQIICAPGINLSQQKTADLVIAVNNYTALSCVIDVSPKTLLGKTVDSCLTFLYANDCTFPKTDYYRDNQVPDIQSIATLGPPKVHNWFPGAVLACMCTCVRITNLMQMLYHRSRVQELGNFYAGAVRSATRRVNQHRFRLRKKTPVHGSATNAESLPKNFVTLKSVSIGQEDTQLQMQSPMQRKQIKVALSESSVAKQTVAFERLLKQEQSTQNLLLAAQESEIAKAERLASNALGTIKLWTRFYFSTLKAILHVAYDFHEELCSGILNASWVHFAMYRTSIDIAGGSSKDQLWKNAFGKPVLTASSMVVFKLALCAAVALATADIGSDDASKMQRYIYYAVEFVRAMLQVELSLLYVKALIAYVVDGIWTHSDPSNSLSTFQIASTDVKQRFCHELARASAHIARKNSEAGNATTVETILCH